MDILYYPDFSPPIYWLRAMLLFSDSVTRIVPDDVNPRDCRQLQEMSEHLGDAFFSISPIADDPEFDVSQLRTLDRAFELLTLNPENRPGESYVLNYSVEGLSVDGYTFLHDSKFTHEVKYMLERHGLLEAGIGGFVKELIPDRFKVVRPDAANLILSLLADRIAARAGLDTATDRELDFALTSANSLGIDFYTGSGRVEGILATAITTLNVPSSIGDLPIKRFLELRKSLDEIRPLFGDVVDQIKQAQRLGRTGDPNLLLERICTAIERFQKKFKLYQNERFSRTLGEWLPFLIQSSLTIAGGFVGDPLLLRALLSAGVGIKLGEKLLLESEKPPEQQLFRALSQLGSKMEKPAPLQQILR